MAWNIRRLLRGHAHPEGAATPSEEVASFRDLRAKRLLGSTDRSQKPAPSEGPQAETDPFVDDGASREDRDRRSRSKHPSEVHGHHVRRGAIPVRRGRKLATADVDVEDDDEEVDGVRGASHGERSGETEQGEDQPGLDGRGDGDEPAPQGTSGASRPIAAGDRLSPRAARGRAGRAELSPIPTPQERRGFIAVAELFNRWRPKVPAARVFDPAAPRSAAPRTWTRAQGVRLYDVAFFAASPEVPSPYEAFEPAPDRTPPRSTPSPAAFAGRLVAGRPARDYVAGAAPMRPSRPTHAVYEPLPLQLQLQGAPFFERVRWTRIRHMTVPMRYAAASYVLPALQASEAPPPTRIGASVGIAATARYITFAAATSTARPPREETRYRPFQPGSVEATPAWEESSTRRSPPLSGIGLEAMLGRHRWARSADAGSAARPAALA